MRLHYGLLLLMALLVALAVLWATTRQGTAATHLAAPPQDPQLTTAAHLEGGAPGTKQRSQVSPTPDDQPPAWRVRSALGLQLVEVELELAGSWCAVSVGLQGDLPLEPTTRAQQVRARGHRACALSKKGETVLVPYASLRFTRFAAERLERWLPMPHWENQRAAAALHMLAGPIAADMWGIAYDPDALAGLVPELEFELHFDNGSRALVERNLDTGGEEEVPWPFACEPRDRAPLTLRLRDGSGTRNSYRVHIHAEVEATVSKRSLHQRYPWGAIQLSEEFEEFLHETQAREFALGPLVLGKRYVVTVLATSTGDHAHARFQHAGGELELQLDAGLLVVGQVSCTPAVEVGALERVRWQFGPRESPYWSDEPGPVALDESGRFRLELPSKVPFAAAAPFPRPNLLQLTFQQPGFERLELQVDTAGLRELDLGTLVLIPRTPVAHLALGHDLSPAQLSWQTLHVPAEQGRALELGIEGAMTLADGSLALFLVEDAPPEVERASFLVLQLDDVHIPLVRRDDGLFERHPCGQRSWEIAVDHTLLAGGERLEFGFGWNGVDFLWASWKARAFVVPRRISLALPAGATPWWSLGRGRRPLPEEDSERLLLR